MSGKRTILPIFPAIKRYAMLYKCGQSLPLFFISFMALAWARASTGAPLDGCTPLDGVYQYHGQTITNVTKNGKHDDCRCTLSFNDILHRTNVGGDIEGAQMTYSKEKSAYEIEILGKHLLTYDTSSQRVTKQTAIKYEIPVTCELGQWMYSGHNSGAGEGAESISDYVIYLSKWSDGCLHIHEVGTGTSTTLFIFKSSWTAISNSSFAPVGANSQCTALN